MTGKMKTQKTYIPKEGEIDRKFYVVDASDKILGRVAARVAAVLRGKDKPIFTPHMDTGDRVIIINAAKVRVTGAKLQQKVYQRYSGYQSGQKSVVLQDMMKIAPTKAMELAVNRMLPKGRLGNSLRSRLRVYAGDRHPHVAQKPISLDV